MPNASSIGDVIERLQGYQHERECSAIVFSLARACVKDCPVMQHANWLLLLGIGGGEGEGGVGFTEKKCNVRGRLG
jgi:hypothetical protein